MNNPVIGQGFACFLADTVSGHGRPCQTFLWTQIIQTYYLHPTNHILHRPVAPFLFVTLLPSQPYIPVASISWIWLWYVHVTLKACHESTWPNLTRAWVCWNFEKGIGHVGNPTEAFLITALNSVLLSNGHTTGLWQGGIFRENENCPMKTSNYHQVYLCLLKITQEWINCPISIA